MRRMNPRELLLEPIAYMPPARALDGLPTDVAERRPAGWIRVAPGSWLAWQTRFLDGLHHAVALGEQPALLDQPLTPPIEFPPLAHYTVLDALIHIANHNSHHLGQIITIRQLLGAWPPPSGSYTW